MKEMPNDVKEIRLAAALVRRVGRRSSAVRRAPQAGPLNGNPFSTFIPDKSGSADLHPSSFASGFTLVELMVAIALVVVIMLGIGKVFKLTSDTVGGGMAISSMARDDRAAQVTMQNDFAAAASDSPVFMICSERTGAFLTQADKTSDLDGDPMTVADPNGAENTAKAYSLGGSEVPAAIYGDRNHRVDRIGFFARGQFTRQTSNDNQHFTPSDPVTTSEAYIWYGHVRMKGALNNPTSGVAALFNNSNKKGVDDTGYPLPGYKVNNTTQVDGDVNNYGCYESNPIASNWVLGRYAMGLADGQTIPAGTPCLTSLGSNTGVMTLSPLGMTTLATIPTAPGTTVNGGNSAPYYPIGGGNYCYIYSSRYDLAATTISEFRSIVTAAWNANQITATPKWWWPLVYEGDYPTTHNLTNAVALRYECNPYVDKPITGTGMAGTVPYFVPHVTQFIVEFAGDYLTQNDALPPARGTSGYITDEAPDGKIDFYYDKSADPNATNASANPALWVRKIRWYGLPRDTSGATIVNGNPIVGPDGAIPSHLNPSIGGDPNLMADVVPYSDVAAMATAHTSPPNFEVETPIVRQDYALPNPSNGGGAPGVGMAGNEHYYCIWRNGAPKLVRILMKIDDPNSRVRQGRWIEQVFAVQ